MPTLSAPPVPTRSTRTATARPSPPRPSAPASTAPPPAPRPPVPPTTAPSVSWTPTTPTTASAALPHYRTTALPHCPAPPSPTTRTTSRSSRRPTPSARPGPLDSNQRFRGWTTETNISGTWTQTAAKTNHYDSDNPRWINEDTSGNIIRNVDGPAGDLAAVSTATGGTVLELANLHGDITLQLPLDTTLATTVLDTDEYGNPRAGQQPARYA
ncbi:hypothetical protein [Streptomyces sp. LN325]|uniref:hypothetical protein n=1 Tax=Streptomyces sp. LN325 TaxID=3112976 RepID=UPI003715185A